MCVFWTSVNMHVNMCTVKSENLLRSCETCNLDDDVNFNGFGGSGDDDDDGESVSTEWDSFSIQAIFSILYIIQLQISRINMVDAHVTCCKSFKDVSVYVCVCVCWRFTQAPDDIRNVQMILHLITMLRPKLVAFYTRIGVRISP